MDEYIDSIAEKGAAAARGIIAGEFPRARGRGRMQVLRSSRRMFRRGRRGVK